MGIKKFSEMFVPDEIIKPSSIMNKNIAIDAMTELYRASLGGKSLDVLTTSDGKPTMHINVLLSVIMNFYKNKNDQIWVFDYCKKENEEHNTIKNVELRKRKTRKELAIKKLESLMPNEISDEEEDLVINDLNDLNNLKNITNGNAVSTDTNENAVSIDTNGNAVSIDTNGNAVSTDTNGNAVSTDDLLETETDTNDNAVSIDTNDNAVSIDTNDNAVSIDTKDKQSEINKYTKRAFTVSEDIIKDAKYILNCLNIKYVDAPITFEGESIASYLVEQKISDAVYSGDSDPIAYGAHTLYRYIAKNKVIHKYTISNILSQISMGIQREATFSDFLKVAVVLGTDSCEKTAGIGTKTLYKKFNNIELTDEQTKAIVDFNKRPKKEDVVIHNINKIPFQEDGINNLIDWLATVKNFNRDRVTKMFQKLTNEVKPVKVAKVKKTKQSVVNLNIIK